jgi:hypothetical protein
MASKAPFRVVNVPEAVPDEAVRVTCFEYPAREQQSKIARSKDLLKPRFLRPIY